MKQNVIINIKIFLLRKSTWNVLFLLFVISLIGIVNNTYLHIGECIDNVSAASANYIMNGNGKFVDILTYLSLVLLVLPYGNISIDDRKTNANFYLMNRTEKRTWYLAQLIVVIGGTFLVFLLPLLSNIGLNQIIYDENGNYKVISEQGQYLQGYFMDITGAGSWTGRGLIFRKLVYFYPQLYNVLYALLFSASLAIIAGFVYSISLYMKHMTVIIYVLPLLGVLGLRPLDMPLYDMSIPLTMDFAQYVTVSFCKAYTFYLGFWVVCFILLMWSFSLARMKGMRDEL